MAKAILKFNPSLTKEKLKAVLSTRFAPIGYEVGFSSLIAVDIYVRKSGWTGVAIKLKQKSDSTFLVINGYAPSIAVRLLLYGIITILILLPKWRKLEKEVSDYVTSEQFDVDIKN
jgi:hypothetical protein